MRSFAGDGDAASALELFGRTWRLWHAHMELDDGRAAARAALEAQATGDVTPWRARTLYADGLFAFRAGDMDATRIRNLEALAVARKTSDLRGESDALTGLARIALRDGDLEKVVALAGQARDAARASGDADAEASPLHLLAAGVRLQQRYALARDLYLESLNLNRKRGDAGWVAMEEHNLGWVELHLGNVDEAEERFRNRDASDQPDEYGAAWSELNWAAVDAMRGNLDRAKRRLDAGRERLSQLGVVLDPDDSFELDWLVSRVERP
ncbi:MAG TPA: tetratricopeptide repeat protein [Candidatus Limnocylindrales bacterium]|nr:tetratricopeptide repeat protein [Candidatus Limnocylindrales bacterium]